MPGRNPNPGSTRDRAESPTPHNPRPLPPYGAPGELRSPVQRHQAPAGSRRDGSRAAQSWLPPPPSRISLPEPRIGRRNLQIRILIIREPRPESVEFRTPPSTEKTAASGFAKQVGQRSSKRSRYCAGRGIMSCLRRASLAPSSLLSNTRETGTCSPSTAKWPAQFPPRRTSASAPGSTQCPAPD